MFHVASGCVMTIISCYNDDSSTGSIDVGEVKFLSSKEVNSTVSMRQIYIDECQKGKDFYFIENSFNHRHIIHNFQIITTLFNCMF